MRSTLFLQLLSRNIRFYFLFVIALTRTASNVVWQNNVVAWVWFRIPKQCHKNQWRHTNIDVCTTPMRLEIFSFPEQCHTICRAGILSFYSTSHIFTWVPWGFTWNFSTERRIRTQVFWTMPECETCFTNTFSLSSSHPKMDIPPLTRQCCSSFLDQHLRNCKCDGRMSVVGLFKSTVATSVIKFNIFMLVS